MIPVFPQFKYLELHDKEQLEGITRQHHPYSDYNFTSLWSWDIDNTIQVSQLNNNLVLRFSDYATREQFFSFLGTNDVDDTIEALLLLAQEEGLTAALKLIPEVSTEHIQQSHLWVVEEDIDNHDYILSVEGVASLKGNRYADQRNLVNRFRKRHPEHEFRTIDVRSPETQNEIRGMLKKWAEIKGASKEEVQNEFNSIDRHISFAPDADIIAHGLYVDNEMVGFATNEVLGKDFAMAHYRKGDTGYAGVYQFMEHEVAKHLSSHGCTHMNYEQDLGIAALRRVKTAWRPTQFLKKYTIRRASIQ